MIGSLFLAAIARCAVVELCPTNADLFTMIQARDEIREQNLNRESMQGIARLVDEAASHDPEPIPLFITPRIKNIADVLCGSELTDQPGTVTCRFTVRYWRDNEYLIAKIVKRGDHWEIKDALSLNRTR